MKKIFIAALVIIAAALALGLAKDMVIKVSVEKGVEAVTGLKLDIGSFRSGLINSLVDIRNLRLFNPAGFRDRMMADVPQVYVAYDLPSIMKGKVHLREVRLNLKEFLVVKNEDGVLNLNSLKVVKARKEDGLSGKKTAGRAPGIGIDKLRLKVGKVVYKDYSAGGKPRVVEYGVNIDEEYNNITDPYSLVGLIVVKALRDTSISSLANFDLKGLEGTVSGTLGTAQKAAIKTVETAQTVVKNTGEAAKKTQEAVKEAAAALEDVFKNPFGK